METTTSITFRLTEEEKKMLKALAKANHLSISAFIRVKCLK